MTFPPIHLKLDAGDIVVAVQVDGEWFDVIREHADIRDCAISHIVEPAGIESKIAAERTRRRERPHGGGA